MEDQNSSEDQGNQVVGQTERAKNLNAYKFLQQKGQDYIDGKIKDTDLLLFIQLAPITEEARKTAYTTFNLDVKKILSEQ